MPVLHNLPVVKVVEEEGVCVDFEKRKFSQGEMRLAKLLLRRGAVQRSESPVGIFRLVTKFDNAKEARAFLRMWAMGEAEIR